MHATTTAILRQNCLDSFNEFLETFWHIVVPETLIHNWHMPVLCDEAQVVTERVLRQEAKEYDLVVNVSPGTTKSMIFSVALPAWGLAKDPTMRFICGSYSYPLAMDLSRKSRDIVTCDLYRELFPEVILREDQNAKHHFSTTKGGMRYSVGVGGSVMGLHAHVIIIDDPLDPSEAVSEAELKRCIHWMTNVLPTRKVNKAVTPTILVMQRLHQADPTDLMIRRAKTKPVRHICLPAELTDDVTPLAMRKNYVNGLFDPIRMSRQVLKEAQEDLGQYGYAGQFLQNPIPAGGGMFKTSRLKVLYPRGVRFAKTCRAWDKAGTAGGGAFTAGVKMSRDEYGRYWIRDVIRFQKDSAEREIEIRKAAAEDGYGVFVILEQEGGSGGKESMQSSVRHLPGYRTRKAKVGKGEGDKINRADPFSVQVNWSNVILDGTNTEWHANLIDEMKHFPMSRFSDQIDACSNAFNFLFRKKRRCGSAWRDNESVDDRIRYNLERR